MGIFPTLCRKASKAKGGGVQRGCWPHHVPTVVLLSLSFLQAATSYPPTKYLLSIPHSGLSNVPDVKGLGTDGYGHGGKHCVRPPWV